MREKKSKNSLLNNNNTPINEVTDLDIDNMLIETDFLKDEKEYTIPQEEKGVKELPTNNKTLDSHEIVTNENVKNDENYENGENEEEKIISIEDKEKNEQKILEINTVNENTFSKSLKNLSNDEWQEMVDILEEKNRNLARLVKDLSVEIKNAREESEKQFEVIGRLASEKQYLTSQNKELTVKANKFAYEVDLKEKELKDFKELGSEASEIRNRLNYLMNDSKNSQKELDDNNKKLSDANDKVQEATEHHKELEAKIRQLEDTKESLETVVLQQQAKLNALQNDKKGSSSQENEINIHKTEDYKELDVDLKNAVDELTNEVKAKDRIIIRQISDISELSESIKNKDIIIGEKEERINDLKNDLKKINLMDESHNLIKPNSNGTLLGRVMNNELDLKLKNYIDIPDNQLIQDDDTAKLLELVEQSLEKGLKDLPDKERIQYELNEAISKSILSYVRKLVNDEAQSYDYIVALNRIEDEQKQKEYEFKDAISELNQKIRLKESEINKLKIRLYADTNESHPIDEKMARELQAENKRLKVKNDAYKAENDILVNNTNDSMVKKITDLLILERTSNHETEKLLKAELAQLKEKLNDADKKLAKLNGEYFITEIQNQIESLNNFIGKIQKGEVELNSQLINEYYDEAYDKFNKQQLLFEDEIAKRDEVLKVILDDMRDEQGALVELDFKRENNGSVDNEDNTIFDLQEKLKHNNEIIDSIEKIFQSKIVQLDLESKKSLDERIIMEFKENVNQIYDGMIQNIHASAKKFCDELSETNAQQAIELYQTDCNKMAKYYSEAVDELSLEHDTTTNEFSKLLTNVKIKLLCNEFYCLVNYKEKKAIDRSNGLKAEYNEKQDQLFTLSLENVQEMRNNIELKKEKLSDQYNKDLLQLESEIDSVKENIQDINDELEAIKNDQDPEHDEMNSHRGAELMMDLSSRTKVLDYLENHKRDTLEEQYQVHLKDIDDLLEKLAMNEKETKEMYLDRIKNDQTFQKDLIKIEDDINRVYGLKGINDYLQNLNRIDYAFFESLNNKTKKIDQAIQEAKNSNNEILKKTENYKNLILLRNEYERVLQTMKTDFSQVRKYDELSLEFAFDTKQLNFYTKEIEKCKEKMRYGIDNEEIKDSVVMYQAKELEFKKKLEELSVQLDEYKKYSIVEEFITVYAKLENIEQIIKEKGKEI